MTSTSCKSAFRAPLNDDVLVVGSVEMLDAGDAVGVAEDVDVVDEEQGFVEHAGTEKDGVGAVICAVGVIDGGHGHGEVERAPGGQSCSRPEEIAAGRSDEELVRRVQWILRVRVGKKLVNARDEIGIRIAFAVLHKRVQLVQYFEPVRHAVSVGVSDTRIRRENVEFVVCSQAVAVNVSAEIGIRGVSRIEAVRDFDSIRYPIAIAVSLTKVDNAIVVRIECPFNCIGNAVVIRIDVADIEDAV